MHRQPNPWMWLLAFALSACGSDEVQTDSTTDTDPSTDSQVDTDGALDLTAVALTNRDGSCADHVGVYTATATDLTEGTTFTAHIELTSAGTTCTLSSNGIPNHDFNDLGAFATDVAEVDESFTFAANPTAASSPTALTLQYDNAVLLNGVKVDVRAAACYGVGNQPLGQEAIGCNDDGTPWRYDPMSPKTMFGTDSHNAHTQPDGAYHYHGDPGTLYDDTGSTVSGVIGWAADGFPIYGPYIDDGGTIRRVVSGYTLKEGKRVSQDGEGAFPGGSYDGTFVDDYAFTDAGDLDACNGMTVDGQYGYYLTDGYPWVIGCFTGTPDASFRKADVGTGPMP